MRFTHILLGIVDEADDAALRYAARLATATRARITVAGIMEAVPRLVQKLLPAGWDVPKLVREHKQAQVERVVAALQKLGVKAHSVFLRGSPAESLVRQAALGKHDLVVIGAGSVDDVGPVGTTAARLIRQSRCSVLLVHPVVRRGRQRVLCAIDTSPWRGPQARAMNARLLEAAVACVEQLKGELHVLHVWEPIAERVMFRAGLTNAELERNVDDARENAEEELQRTIAPFMARLGRSRVHLEKGDAKKVIGAFARKHKMDLVIISSVGRSGLAGHMIGNTAEAVLAHFSCSMLVLKPAS